MWQSQVYRDINIFCCVLKHNFSKGWGSCMLHKLSGIHASTQCVWICPLLMVMQLKYKWNFFMGLPYIIVCCQNVKVTNVCNFYITRYLLLIHVYIAWITCMLVLSQLVNLVKVKSIKSKHQSNPSQFNAEILEEWLAGKGKQPATWATLVEVLNSIA